MNIWYGLVTYCVLMPCLQEVSALSDLQLENIWYILVDCSSTSNHEELNFEDISQVMDLDLLSACQRVSLSVPPKSFSNEY